MRLKASLFFSLFVAVVATTSSGEISLEVFFSPHGGCTAAIVKEIQFAKTSIKVQAYGFTSEPIAIALIDAKKNGVVVSVILDRSNKTARYSQAITIKKAGINVAIDSAHAIAHNKVLIIDEATIITGSFNFSNNAENNNAENLIIIHDTETAKIYSKNWSSHAEHSTSYRP